MQDSTTLQLRGSGGFTLIEVLASTVVLTLIGVALTAVSLTFIVQVSDDSGVRQGDATTAQWASLVFARDVQGSSGVAPECDPAADGTHLVTMASSEDPTRRIEYRSSASAPYELIRVECTAGLLARSAAPTSHKVVDGLLAVPKIECDSTTCVPGSSPRTITLGISRSKSFSFDLDGVRRTTDANSTAAPTEVPDFLALGGDTPLRVSGSSRLEVVGNAFVNRPSNGTEAVVFNGGARLSVSGDFRLQAGAQCPGCASNSNKVPGSYPEPLLDPLRFLPAPSTTGLPLRTDCPVQGSQRICQPGIYNTQFPPGGGAVKDFRLEPGVYILNNGVGINNGSLTGTGVLLYNAHGGISIRGGEIDLSPQASGVHAGILVFQARDNDSAITINGNASLASLTGTIYAPGSDGVTLGGGTGELRVGRVIGTSLSTSGNGTVVVGGS